MVRLRPVCLLRYRHSSAVFIKVSTLSDRSGPCESVEATHSFTLRGIVPLKGVGADPDFTPELRGVTDKESLANWNPPFPYDSGRVRTRPPHDEDEKYWDDHRATLIQEIADRQNIPVKFLQQILVALKVAGFLQSRKGPGGGYALARPPEQRQPPPI